MTGLRFKVGELAIFVVAVSYSGIQHQGEMVEIMAVGPWPAGTLVMGFVLSGDADYLVRAADGSCGRSKDWQLRKIDPPAEPASLTRESECEVVA